MFSHIQNYLLLNSRQQKRNCWRLQTGPCAWWPLWTSSTPSVCATSVTCSNCKGSFAAQGSFLSQSEDYLLTAPVRSTEMVRNWIMSSQECLRSWILLLKWSLGLTKGPMTGSCTVGSMGQKICHSCHYY